MKKASLYFFIFIYSTVMLKPVMPVITDAVAHILFFKDHMLTVHAHNGKFHVHAEIEQASKNDLQGKSTNLIKKDFFDSEFIAFENNITYADISTANKFASSPFNTSSAFIDHPFPPPRF